MMRALTLLSSQLDELEDLLNLCLLYFNYFLLY